MPPHIKSHSARERMLHHIPKQSKTGTLKTANLDHRLHDYLKQGKDYRWHQLDTGLLHEESMALENAPPCTRRCTEKCLRSLKVNQCLPQKEPQPERMLHYILHRTRVKRALYKRQSWIKDRTVTYSTAKTSGGINLRVGCFMKSL